MAPKVASVMRKFSLNTSLVKSVMRSGLDDSMPSNKIGPAASAVLKCPSNKKEAAKHKRNDEELGNGKLSLSRLPPHLHMTLMAVNDLFNNQAI